MAITEDASSPAAVNTQSATTITTASFSPPAGTLLIALVSSNGVAGTATTATVSQSAGGGTWTLLKRQNTNTASAGGTQEVWSSWQATAPGSVTVNAHQVLGTANGLLLVVKALNGAASVQPGAVAGKESDSSAPTQALVTTVSGSYVYGCLGDFSGQVSAVANAATTIVSQHSDTTNNNTYITCKGATATGAPGSTTFGFTTPATCAYNFALVEILPEPAGQLVEVTRQSLMRSSVY